MWPFRLLPWYSSVFISSGTWLFAFSANISLFSFAFYFIFWRSIVQCKNGKQHNNLHLLSMCALMNLSAVKTAVCLGYDTISCDGSVLTFQRVVPQQNPAEYHCTVQDHTVSHMRSDCCEQLKCRMFLACWYMLVLFLAERYKGACQGFCPYFF